MTPAAVARYLATPARLAPAMFIVVFSVMMTLAAYAGLLGVWLGLLLFFGFIRYSFALLESMNAPAREPPVLAVEMLNPIGEMRSVVILVLASAVFFATDAAAYWMPWFVRVLVGLATLTFLLAIVTVQAATGSIKQAVNPRLSFELIRRLGRDYALIFVCALALYLAACSIAAWKVLPLILRIAVLMYAWLALFALIGGVLRERREDLGVADAEIDPVERSTVAALELEHDHDVDQIYAQWRSGAHANAWRTITTVLERSADPLSELRWLYERIARWPDPRLADRLVQEQVTLLLTLKRHGEVLNLISARLAKKPDFRPRTGDELVQVVEMALNVGDRRIARLLVKDFERLYPDDPHRSQVEGWQEELKR